MLHLLVGIDTESDNQWDREARAHPTFDNIYQLSRLHSLLARHGARPTYFITHPVASDRRSANLLRELHADRGCEIGAHHHAWETPPVEPDYVDRHVYARELSIARFEQQLAILTSAVEEVSGARPVSYRSGRFGFAANHVFALERQGYKIDSSVAPLFNESHKNGPDFVGAPLRPYFLSYDEPTMPGSSNVLEVPISAALNRRVPAAVARAYARAPRRYHVHRILRKLRIARMLWLRPSYSSLSDMKRLAGRLASDGVPVLNLIFHSSEALVGGSPYNRNEADLRAFFDRLERLLEFATGTLGALPATFSEFRSRFCAIPVAQAQGPHAASLS